MSDRISSARHVIGLRGTRGLLVIAETALALMLLSGAGLMLHSFARLSKTKIGFDPSHLLTFRIDAPRNANEETSRQFFAQVLERVAAIPGVQSACLANATPLSDSFDRSSMMIRSAGKSGEAVEASVGVHLASPEYLQTLQVPLLRGRWVSNRDKQGAPTVAVINDAACRKYWPGTDPVGQQVDLAPALGPDFVKVTVVGVVGDVKYDQMDSEMTPNVYISYEQSSYPGYFIALRTAGSPLGLASAVRTAVAAVNRDVAIYQMMTMEQRISNSTSRSQFNAFLLLLFSIMAVVLAAIGLYGLVAYSVAQRTREIGIRIALGAQAADVLRLIMGQGMRLVLCGGLIGLAGALALTRLLRTLLYEVIPADPITFITIPLILAMVASLACWLPARRAARINPIEALRHE